MYHGKDNQPSRSVISYVRLLMTPRVELSSSGPGKLCGPTLIFARLKTISNTENTAADVRFLNKTMGNPQGDKIRERSFGHSDLLTNVVVLD